MATFSFFQKWECRSTDEKGKADSIRRSWRRSSDKASLPDFEINNRKQWSYFKIDN
jgi:hypothetical protein